MAVEKPDRDTTYGAFCAFDDKSEGHLAVSAIQGILGMGEGALSADEVAAFMLDLGAHVEGGKVTVENLLNYLFSEEPIKFAKNDADLVNKQLDFALKLGGNTSDGGKKK